MRFLEYLNETLYLGEYYMSSPVHFNVKNIKYYTLVYDDRGNGKYTAFISFNRNLLMFYKRNLGTNTSMDPKYNFIYSIKGVNCLDVKNEAEVLRAFNKGYFIEYFSMDEFKSSDDKSRYIKEYLTVNFFNEYEGIKSSANEIEIAIFEDGSHISPLKKMKLVDGNGLRFDTGSRENNIELPDYIISELIRYTNDASKKMNSYVKEWLLNNFSKPYNSIKLYRAVGYQFDDWGDFDEVKLKNVEKTIYRYFGVRKLEDLKLGARIELKRGKESSWSTSPVIAINFAKGLAEKNINVLVEATIPAKNIIIDFNLLPKELLKKEFRFWNQNEVIVDTGSINCVIKNIWTDEKFKKQKYTEWLEQNGYVFKANVGFIKI